jgi:hypothetical protein
MKLRLSYFFCSKVVWVCLVFMLGLHGAAWAAPTAKRKPQAKVRSHSRSIPKKSEKSKQTPQKKEEDVPNTALPQGPPLKKPKPLKQAQIAYDDPLVALDQLVVQQHVAITPYVPFVQTIDIAIDYGRLFMNLISPREHRYEGSLSVLFKKNILLSMTVGYEQPAKEKTAAKGNKCDYTVEGMYGRVGLDYFARYNLRSNLYTGLRYGRSHFTNSTQPASEKVIRQPLTASWWEVVVGSEYQIFKDFGLYTGFIFHLKVLGNFDTFKPATNYIVPGYGRNVNLIEPSITLYIKYKISFLEKKISFQ